MARFKAISLLASVASLALAGAARADTLYLESANWKVWEAPVNGGAACHMKAFSYTTAGYAAFGIGGGFYSNGAAAPALFAYQEQGFRWTSNGTITVRIGGFAPWSLRMTVNQEAPEQLVLFTQDGTSMQRFMQELAAGSSLSITTLSGTRYFSLTGSAAAYDAWGRCLGDVQTAATVQPLPRPRAPVTQIAPGRML